MRNYSKVLKIAPAFLLAGTMMLEAQQRDSIKQRDIEQVVLIGYGAKKKSDLTGSVAALSEKDFNKGANQTPENLLQGKVAGVNISTGGSPGAGSTIRIRGGASLGAKNDPLIVLDGLPIDNNTPGGATSILSSINPNDIESFSVLKDASASAIYGSRASNGVIVIATKKGGKKLQVQYTAKTSYNTVDKLIDVYGADEFREMVKALNDPSATALLGTSNTNWQKEIFHNTVSFDNSISVRGNLLNKIPSRLSFGYMDNPGILKTSNFQRTTAAVSLNPFLWDKHLKLDFNANLSWVKNRFGYEDAISNALRMDPTQAVYDDTSANGKTIPFGGYFEWLQPGGDLNLLTARNPVAMLMQRNNSSTSKRIWGNFQVDYKLHFFKDLRAIVNLGYDKINGDGTETTSNQSASGYQPYGVSNSNYINYGGYRSYWDKRENKLLDAYLAYNKELNNLNISLTGGYSYQMFSVEKYNSGGNDYNPDELKKADITKEPDVNLQSFFGRANFDFYKKYFLTLTYRRDGSSRFSEANRWGNFPGAAFAWKIKDSNASSGLSNLKLRLGWGITGQQDVDAPYDYVRRISTGTSSSQYSFGNTFYTVARFEGYGDLKWEETTQWNAGLDFGFLRNRITGTIDLYDKTSRDLLAYVSSPDMAGTRNQGYANIGNFNTKGIELGLNFSIIKSEDVNWDLSYNVSYNKRKVTELGLTVPGFDGFYTGDIDGGSGNQVQIHTVGYAPNSFYVYEQVYDQNGKPLQGVYVDRNGDGVVNNNDRYRYKKPNADYLMGLSSTFNYKDLDFGMAWRASIGNYAFNNVASNYGYNQNLSRHNALANLSTDFSNSGFTSEDNGTFRYLSDYFVTNASFLKLDNVSLGYTIRNFMNKGTLRLSGTVQNVLTITDYEGLDPEIQNNGIDKVVYPRARMFIFGLDMKF